MAKLLKRELAPLIDEAIPEDLGMVTLTDVEVQRDFKEAKVYISCFNQSRENDVLKVLDGKLKDFQKILGSRLEMRYTSKISFHLDHSLKNVDKVEHLLNVIKNKKGRSSVS